MRRLLQEPASYFLPWVELSGQERPLARTDYLPRYLDVAEHAGLSAKIVIQGRNLAGIRQRSANCGGQLLFLAFWQVC